MMTTDTFHMHGRQLKSIEVLKYMHYIKTKSYSALDIGILLDKLNSKSQSEAIYIHDRAVLNILLINDWAIVDDTWVLFIKLYNIYLHEATYLLV